MKIDIDKNREGMAIGFGLGLILFYLYYRFSFFSPILSPIAAITTSTQQFMIVMAIIGLLIGYFVDDNLKESKWEKKLRKWV